MGSVISMITATNTLAEPINKSRTRIAVAAFYFLQGLCFASWAIRIADIKTNLNLSAASLATALIALPIGQLLMLMFSGRIVAHFGSKKVLTLAIILYALELTNLGWAAQKWQLTLALFVFGIFGNLCNISINTQGVGVEKIYRRPIMASFHGAWSTAGVTGAAIGSLMIYLRLTPRAHFMIVAGITILLSLIARQYLLPGNDPQAIKKKFFSRPDKVLFQLGIIGFCSLACEGAMFDWSGVYFKEVVKAPHNLVILGYASFMVMMATGRFAGDRIIAKVGRKKMLQVSGLLIGSGLLTAVCFPYIVIATIGFLIVGCGVSSVVPTIYSTAGRHSKVSPSMALAAVSGIGFFGFLLGPPLIGYIAQAAGLRYSFAVIALIGFCISIMVTKLKVLD